MSFDSTWFRYFFIFGVIRSLIFVFEFLRIDTFFSAATFFSAVEAYRPTHKFTGGFQEIQSLPVLRRESGRVWYANCRLAYMVVTIYIFGLNYRRGLYRTYVTRVVERSCAHMLTIAEDILKSLDVAGASIVHWWKDRAPYWTCYKWLGTLATELMKIINIPIYDCWGFGSHFKSIIDGSSLSLNMFVAPPLRIFFCHFLFIVFFGLH